MHSGSRGLGEAILRETGGPPWPPGIDRGQRRMPALPATHDLALRFAEANRQLIARRMLDRLRGAGQPLLDINHNLVSPVRIDGAPMAGCIARRDTQRPGRAGDPRFAR